MSDFFKFFNALQITAFFAAYPFLLMWLSTPNLFSGSKAAFTLAIIVYVVFFGVIMSSVFRSMFKD